MSERQSSSSIVRFGVFEMNSRTGQLRKRGALVRLQGMPLRILEALLADPGELVTREEIRDRLWPNGTFVDFQNSINSAVNRLREALGDSADNPRFVETVPRRGYRFIAPVDPGDPAQPDDRPSAPNVTGRQPGFRPWLLGLAGAFLVAAALAATYTALSLDARRPPQRPLLAVLPFEDLSPTSEDDYLSDGLTDELISYLGRLDPKALGVIARTSAMSYKGTTKSLAQISAELGVGYVLEGSLRREGEIVRISVQLVQASDQTQLWSVALDRRLDGILDLQREVAARVSRSLAPQLLPGETPRPYRPKPGAFDSYLKGRYHWNKQAPEPVLKSIGFFEKAIESDPGYALAHAGLADAYNSLAGYGYTPATQAYESARQAALTALELDDRLAEGHAALALPLLFIDRDWEGSRRALETALELNPSLMTAYFWLGCYLVASNRPLEAIDAVQTGLGVDPLSFSARSTVGWYYLFARDYDQAIVHCRRTLELEPDFHMARIGLELAYIKNGMYREALEQGIAFFERLEVPEETLSRLRTAQDPRAGVRLLWEMQLQGLERKAEKSYVSPYLFALHHAVLQRPEKALDWLEKGLEEQASPLLYLAVDSTFDLLRSQPRFQRLLEKLDLPPAADLAR